MEKKKPVRDIHVLTTDPNTGETVSLSQLSAAYNINIYTIVSRWYKGERGHDLIRDPILYNTAGWELDKLPPRRRVSDIKISEFEKTLPTPPPHPEYEDVGY